MAKKPAKSLFKAVETGGVADVAKLLDDGTAVDARDAKNFTPLMMAILRRKSHIVRLLLDRGADPNALQDKYQSVLSFALVVQEPKLTEMLLAKGADVNFLKENVERGEYVYTPLMQAVQFGLLTQKNVELLLAAGAEVNVRRTDGETALAIARRYTKETMVRREGKRLVEILFAAGAKEEGDPSFARVADPIRALWSAVDAGDLAGVERALADGAPIDSVNATTLTPVLHAACKGKYDLFELLTKAGADLHAGDKTGNDAMLCAASGGDVRIVRTLLDAGFAVDGPAIKDKRFGRHTPLMTAAFQGHVEVARVLLDAGADIAERHAKSSVLDFGKMSNRRAMVNFLKTLMDDSAEDDIANLFASFAATAKTAEFAAVREWLSKFTSVEPKKVRRGDDEWQCTEGVLSFAITAAKLFALKSKFAETGDRELPRDQLGLQLLERLCALTRTKGFLLVQSDIWIGSKPPALHLYPTADSLAVVAARGTNGVNHGIDNADVVRWLRELGGNHPFVVSQCGYDMVGGPFLNSIEPVVAVKLAKSMYKFCPDIVDQGTRTVKKLAKELVESQSFYFWWD